MSWSIASGVSRRLWWALVVLIVFVAFVTYGRAVEGTPLRASLAAATGTVTAQDTHTGGAGTGDTGTGDVGTGGAPSSDGGSSSDAGDGFSDGTATPSAPTTPEKLAVVGTVLDALASILPAAPSLGQVAGGNVIAVLNLLPPEVFGPVLQVYTSLFDALNTGALSMADMAEQLNAALAPLAAFVNPAAGAIGGSAIDGAAALLVGAGDGAELLGHHVSYLSWLADNLAVYKDTFYLE